MIRLQLTANDQPYNGLPNSEIRIPISDSSEVNSVASFTEFLEIMKMRSRSERESFVNGIRDFAVFAGKAPVSSQLPIHYHSVPSKLRDWVAKGIGFVQRSRQEKWAEFPQFPLDLSVDYLTDSLGLSSIKFSQSTPVLLTHDIDSREGLDHLGRLFLPLERSLGVRSTSYVVPKAFPLDFAILDDVVAGGGEVGVHGFDHSNRTPYLPADQIEKRIRQGHEPLARYNPAGYRSPSLCRTPALIEGLRKLYKYDSSVPTSGGLFPVPNNGCATARPFMIGSIPEIPLSMPRDGSLIFLGYKPDQILNLWIECAERIRKAGGIVNLLTHCETRFSGNPRMMDVYRGFIEYLSKSGGFEFMTGQELYNQLPKHSTGEGN